MVKNWEITMGKDISELAKITGITPAVLTFSGITAFCPPPIILRPCSFCVYCTGMRRSASHRRTTKTTITRMQARMISPATTAVATDLAFRMKRSNSVPRSFGREEMMLIRRTMEMPFPTPLSVILSPIHIRKALPAVIAATATRTLFTLKL